MKRCDWSTACHVREFTSRAPLATRTRYVIQIRDQASAYLLLFDHSLCEDLLDRRIYPNRQTRQIGSVALDQVKYLIPYRTPKMRQIPGQPLQHVSSRAPQLRLVRSRTFALTESSFVISFTVHFIASPNCPSKERFCRAQGNHMHILLHSVIHHKSTR
jgi:hypothetical protein